MSSKKLNTEEAAAFLGVKPCTLEVWRCKKKGPKYAKLGSRVMYDQQELENWFASRSVHTIDSAPQLRSRI
jgi:predicted DNA-binding transcriptional regulator AlpA